MATPASVTATKWSRPPLTATNLDASNSSKPTCCGSFRQGPLLEVAPPECESSSDSNLPLLQPAAYSLSVLVTAQE